MPSRRILTTRYGCPGLPAGLPARSTTCKTVGSVPGGTRSLSVTQAKPRVSATCTSSCWPLAPSDCWARRAGNAKTGVRSSPHKRSSPESILLHPHRFIQKRAFSPHSSRIPVAIDEIYRALRSSSSTKSSGHRGSERNGMRNGDFLMSNMSCMPGVNKPTSARD